MKKLFYLSLIFLLFFVGYKSMTSKYRSPSALALSMGQSQTPSVTSVPATQTPIPSATIDYQATLAVAQSTADEARRVNALVTAEFQDRALKQLQMTAEYEQRVQQIYYITATAALTSIPLTATQQAISNAQFTQRNQILAAQLTATNQYPTQIMEISNAQNRATFGKLGTIVSLFAIGCLGVLMLAGAVWIMRNPVIRQAEIESETETQPVPQMETVTRINLYKNNGSHSELHNIPCSPEQFTEFSEALTGGLRQFEINRWQREGVYLKDDIKRVRAWARISKLVIEMPNNQLAPKDELIELCNGWLNTKILPDGFEFAPTDLGVEEIQTPISVGEQESALEGLTLLHSPTSQVSS